MDRQVTPPKQVTSPTWGPHLHVNKALTYLHQQDKVKSYHRHCI